MDAPVAIGNILLGKYRVERMLGQGGMGVVVAVRHVDLKQSYAMKFLLPKLVQDPDVFERFLREAQAAAQISSEYVARVHDVGRMSDNTPYMIMEYLDGCDLKTFLAEHGRLPVEDAIGFVLDACDAIAEAHALGIIHRDLKPANMFVVRRRNGSFRLKVLDFGIAKHTASDKVEITDTDEVLGSPLYMSPEQITKSKMVDNRSDIWALGLTGYELLTGVSPFRAETKLEVVTKVLHEEPCALRDVRPDVPEPVAEAIMRCLQKNRDERWASVEQLGQILGRYVSRVSTPRMLVTNDATLPPDCVTSSASSLGTTVDIPKPQVPKPAARAERTDMPPRQTENVPIVKRVRKSYLVGAVAVIAVATTFPLFASRFLGSDSTQQNESHTVEASPQVLASTMPTAPLQVENAQGKPAVVTSSEVRKDEPPVASNASVRKTVTGPPRTALTTSTPRPTPPTTGAPTTSAATTEDAKPNIDQVPEKPKESASAPEPPVRRWKKPN